MGHADTRDIHLGFSFRRRSEPVDWKKLASIDVERLCEELDFQTLQDNVSHITFCNIENEVDTKKVDPNFIKLFRISQLIAEYLLTCQDYLGDSLKELEIKCTDLEEELKRCRHDRDEKSEKLKEMAKENKKRRKMIEQQQLLVSDHEAIFKCPHCPKAFLNVSYLQSHVHRRHFVYQSSPIVDPAVQEELTQVKKLLKEAEIALRTHTQTKEDEFKTQKEMEISKQIQELHKLMESQRQLQQEDIKSQNTTLFEELSLMNQKFRETQNELRDLKANRNTEKPNSDIVQAQQNEIVDLKSLLTNKLNHFGKDVQFKLEQQENEWSAKVDQIQISYKRQIQQLNKALEEQRMQTQTEMKSILKERKTWQINPNTPKSFFETRSQENLNIESPKRSQNSFRRDQTVVSKMLPESEEESELSDRIIIQEEKTLSDLKINKTYKKKSKNKKLSTLPAKVWQSPKEKLAEIVETTPGLIVGLKEELSQVLKEKLESLDIKEDETLLNEAQMKRKMKILESERKNKAIKFTDFQSIREKCQLMLQKKFNREKSKDICSPSRRKEIKTKPNKSSTKDSKESPIKPVSSFLSPKRHGLSNTGSLPESTKKLTFTQPEVQNVLRYSEIQSEESSLEEEEEEELTNGDDQEDEENDDNESYPVIAVNPITPRNLSPQHAKSESESEDEIDIPQPIRVRPAIGVKVAQLASTIEAQLTNRKSGLIISDAGSSKKRNLIGAVDTLGPLQSQRRLSGNAGLGMYADTSSISSLEKLMQEINSSTPNKITKSSTPRRKQSWDSDDLSIDELK